MMYIGIDYRKEMKYRELDEDEFSLTDDEVDILFAAFNGFAFDDRMIDQKNQRFRKHMDDFKKFDNRAYDFDSDKIDKLTDKVENASTLEFIDYFVELRERGVGDPIPGKVAV